MVLQCLCASAPVSRWIQQRCTRHRTQQAVACETVSLQCAMYVSAALLEIKPPHRRDADELLDSWSKSGSLKIERGGCILSLPSLPESLPESRLESLTRKRKVEVEYRGFDPRTSRRFVTAPLGIAKRAICQLI